jgi:hypothetical protein
MEMKTSNNVEIECVDNGYIVRVGNLGEELKVYVCESFDSLVVLLREIINIDHKA